MYKITNKLNPDADVMSICHFNCIFLFLFFLQLANIQVPFLFKYLVDHLNDSSNFLNVATPESTIITVATALVIGCMFILKNSCSNINNIVVTV